MAQLSRAICWIAVVMTLLSAILVVEAATLKCYPQRKVNQRQCMARIAACEAEGVTMKWAGIGCRRSGRPVGDGGCQCNHYCGYLCPEVCSADPQCFWNPTFGTCFTRLSGQPGVPMGRCFNVTGRPTTSPTTSLPTTSPTPKPSAAPTPPTTLAPTTQRPSKAPTTPLPTISPSTKSPTPATKSPTSACGSCVAPRSCVQGACVGQGELQISMIWPRDAQMRIWVYPPSAGTWLGTTNPNMPNANSAFGTIDRNDIPADRGPANAFWPISTTRNPPSGSYRVCAETWYMPELPSPQRPLNVTVIVTQTIPSFKQRTFWTILTVDTYDFPSATCIPTGTALAANGGLVATFTYPLP